MTYKNYTLYIHPLWTEFGSKICFVKQAGLTVTKVTGLTEEAAIEAGKRWVDRRLR